MIRCFGELDADVQPTNNGLIVNGKKILAFSERDPSCAPLRNTLGIDVVIESTGFFTDGREASRHLEAGAKKVVISAPAKNEDITVVLGVNDDKYDKEKHHIISNASCVRRTVLRRLPRCSWKTSVSIVGLMTTIHSYTNDQQVLDLPHEDIRRARAAVRFR